MTKNAWKKRSSDLRRVLHYDINRAGRFCRIDLDEDRPTIYIYNANSRKIIARIVSGTVTMSIEYRKSPYRDIVHRSLLHSGVECIVTAPSDLSSYRMLQEDLRSDFSRKIEGYRMRQVSNQTIARIEGVGHIRDPYLMPPRNRAARNQRRNNGVGSINHSRTNQLSQ